MALPSLEDQTAILFATSVLYGLYLATLPSCLRWLLYDYSDWKPPRHINWPMLLVTLVIFASTTLDVVLIVRRNLLGIVNEAGSNLIWSNTAQSFLAHVQTLIADAVLTYRCWIVYSKSWVSVAAPIFLLLVDVACMIVSAYWQQNQAEFPAVGIIIVVFWACSIAIDLYATVLIAYKITVIAKIRSLPTRHVIFAMRVIIESGLLYTITSVMLFISFFFPNLFVQYFLSSLNFQAVGIMSNLILIRVLYTSTPMVQGYSSTQPLTTAQFTSNFASDVSYDQQKGHYLSTSSRLDSERGRISHVPVE